MNTSKIHLHVEQFSQKTNWNLAESLLCNKAVRKIHMESGRKGREGIRLGTVPRGEGQRKREITWVEMLTGE